MLSQSILVWQVEPATCTTFAQAPLRVFDAHLHYNQEPTPFYDLDKVLEIFRRNNITGIIATSRPNKGTHQLVDATVECRGEQQPLTVLRGEVERCTGDGECAIRSAGATT